MAKSADRDYLRSSILFVIQGTANFVLSEAELNDASDISPRPYISTLHGCLIPIFLNSEFTPILMNITRYKNMASDDLIRRGPQSVTNDASGIESSASNQDAAHSAPTRVRTSSMSPASNQDAVQNPPTRVRTSSMSPASNQDAVQNLPTQGRSSPTIPGEPWRESQWSTYLAFSCADEMLKSFTGQAIEKIVGGIARLPHLRRHQHDVRDLVGLPAACRSYYQKVEEILDLMYKYLEIGHHHGDRDQHSSNPPRMMIENLRRVENPLLLIIGGGEEYQFLRDSRTFRNTPRDGTSSFTNADVAFLQQFCDGNIPERIESALGVAVDCIKVDAERRHTGAELLAVLHVEDPSPEVFGQMMYFHYCRRSSVHARQESRIEELEATVNTMLTVQDDLRAHDARLLDSLHRAEQEAETAENELEAQRTLRQQAEATVNNMLNVEDDLRAQSARLFNSLHGAEQEAETAQTEREAERTLRQHAEATVNNMLNVENNLRAQNARLLNSLHGAEQQADITENELQAERTLRQQDEADRWRAVRRAELRLRDEYARQHDEWYHDLRNYRTDREQYGPAFKHSVEAPGRASGYDRSWLDLRRETNQLCIDLAIANDAQAGLQADLSRVIRQRNHALRERDDLHNQLPHAQVHHVFHHLQIERPNPQIGRPNPQIGRPDPPVRRPYPQIEWPYPR